MNCQNCKNYVFGRCTVTNLSVGPDVLCNAWELSQSWEMVDMQFATFDADELQKRIASLEAERNSYRALCKELESRLDFYYANTNNVIAKENENLKDKIAELKKLVAQLVEVGNALIYPDGVFDDEQSEIEFKWHEIVRSWKEAKE